MKEANEVEEAEEMDYERAFLTPAFTTTSIAIVGAPTFWFLRAGKGNPKNRSRKAGPATT